MSNVANQPTVWIAQWRNDLDFASAQEWGKLKVLTEVEVPTTFIGPEYRQFALDVVTFLTDMDREHDSVLLSGNPVQMMMIAAALSKECDWINILKWDPKFRKYNRIRVPLEF